MGSRNMPETNMMACIMSKTNTRLPPQTAFNICSDNCATPCFCSTQANIADIADIAIIVPMAPMVLPD